MKEIHQEASFVGCRDHVEELPSAETESSLPASSHRAYEILKTTRQLPTPAEKAFQVFMLAQDPDVEFNQLAEIVMTDPALSASIFDRLKKAYFKASYAPETVEQAIIRLGLNPLVQICLNISVISGPVGHLVDACPGFDYDLFWSESLARAVAAKYIAQIKSGRIRPSQAYTVGLLCQIGRLALASTVPERYSCVLEAASSYDIQLLIAGERREFGIDHYELGASMMKDWGLPDYYCEVVRHQPSGPDEYPLSMSLSAELQQLLTESNQMLGWSKLISNILTRPGIRSRKSNLDLAMGGAIDMGVSIERFGNCFNSITDEWNTMAGVVNIKTQSISDWKQLYAAAI